MASKVIRIVAKVSCKVKVIHTAAKVIRKVVATRSHNPVVYAHTTTPSRKHNNNIHNNNSSALEFSN